MTYLLSIETSTKVCSASLQEDDRLLGSFTIYMDRSHAEQLGRFTEKLLNLCSIKPGQLAGVAVSAGPGSYTGLRIGTSFAKGLCYALDIPLITVGSLEGLALAVRNRTEPDAFIIPMMDARRMEVYMQVFDGRARPLTDPRPFLLEEENVDEYLDKGRCYFTGNGSEKASVVIKHPNAEFIGGVETEARFMHEAVWRKYREKDFADLAYFEPEYLKEFRATKPKKLL